MSTENEFEGLAWFKLGNQNRETLGVMRGLDGLYIYGVSLESQPRFGYRLPGNEGLSEVASPLFSREPTLEPIRFAR